MARIVHVTSKVRLIVNNYDLYNVSAQNPKRPEFFGYTVAAEKLYMHPHYTTRHKWDLCLIKLSETLNFDSNVTSIGGV